MQWDKVFTTGRHTDSSDNVKVWTTEDLDRMVASFNPSYHEPPIVIGHPSDNAPAFGWVAGIKREGCDLFLSYKDVNNQFKEWVGQGLFKKKSIAVYPDGSLRHIGYLGAMPPAIKGLPDFAFADNGRVATFYDYEDMTVATLFHRMREWIIGKFGQDEADKVLPDYQITDLQTSAAMPEETDTGTPCPTFKEESMKPEEVQALVTEAVTAVTQQFSEQIKGLTQKIDALTEEGAAGREANQRREFREFLMTPEMQKRVNEGSREATINHMMNLVSAAPVEFGEGDSKTTKPALDVYKDQLKSLPEVVAFGEAITKEKAGHVSVDGLSAETIAKKAVEFQESEAKAGRTVTMTDAVNHVTAGGK